MKSASVRCVPGLGQVLLLILMEKTMEATLLDNTITVDLEIVYNGGYFA